MFSSANLPKEVGQTLTLEDNEVNRYRAKTYIKSFGFIHDTRMFTLKKVSPTHFNVLRKA